MSAAETSRTPIVPGPTHWDGYLGQKVLLILACNPPRFAAVKSMRGLLTN